MLNLKFATSAGRGGDHEWAGHVEGGDEGERDEEHEGVDFCWVDERLRCGMAR